MVGRGDDDVGLGVAGVDDAGGIGDAGGGVAACGLAEHLVALEPLNLLSHTVGIELAGHDDDVFAWTNAFKTAEGALQHRLPRTQDIEELFGVVGFANGPEAASVAASHDDTVVVLVHVVLVFFRLRAASAPKISFNYSAPVPRWSAPGPTWLHAHLAFDMGVWVVALQLEVLIVEVEDALHLGVEAHGRQRPRVARELEAALVQVVVVYVGVAESVDEVAVLEAAHLCNHHGEEGIGGDVERHAEEDVGRALVELAAEAAVDHIELEEDMAGREMHRLKFADVPGGDEEAARVGVVLYLLDERGDLIDLAAVGAAPGAPLMAVDGAEVAVGAGPLVPDGDFVVVEVLHISVAAQEPQQLVYDGAQMQLLGGEQREAVIQVEAHLVAEDAARPRPRAVLLGHPVVQHMLQ